MNEALLKHIIDINNGYVPIRSAYIDPGTGSMLFTILIGLISAIVYGFRGLFIKLKVKLSGGKKVLTKDSIPFVIYSEGKNYWTTFKLICDEFEKRKISLIFLSSSKDDPIFNEKYEYVKTEFIGEGNKAFAKLNMLKADIVLSTTPGLDVYQWKRSKDVKWYVHIFHSANNAIGYRMFGIDYYDAIICVNKHYIEQIRELEQKRGIKQKELLVFGVPYLDLMKSRINSVELKKNKKITVLLAPSWGKNSIFNVYGKSILDVLLMYDYQIIVRPHPQSYVSEKEMIDSLMNEYKNLENIIWDNNSDNFDSLCKSDILISDFSGILFDFALVFKKPIIYADVSYDSSFYDACWIDENTWTFLKDVLPKIGNQLNKNNLNSLNEIIASSMNDKDKALARENAIKDTWEQIGNCSKLTVDYLIKKHKELEGDTK